MSFEYKAVGAPERGKRRKGAHSQSDRAAAAFEEVLEAEAVDGWEYLRTDILPVVERLSWFGGRREAQRAVMVFRRALASERPTEAPILSARAEAAVPLAADPRSAPEGPEQDRMAVTSATETPQLAAGPKSAPERPLPTRTLFERTAQDAQLAADPRPAPERPGSARALFERAADDSQAGADPDSTPERPRHARMLFQRAAEAAQLRADPKPTPKDPGHARVLFQRAAEAAQLRADPKPTPEKTRPERREPGISADPDMLLTDDIQAPRDKPGKEA